MVLRELPRLPRDAQPIIFFVLLPPRLTVRSSRRSLAGFFFLMFSF